MNMIALVAAVMILTADSNNSGRHGNTRVSAAIEYRTIDRSGNELIVSVSNGDPYFGRYYGRDYFYYDDCYYYRYYPVYRYVPVRHYPVRRTIVVHEPVLIVENRYYDHYDDDDHWKAVREHEKGISKAIKAEGKWGRSNDRVYVEQDRGRIVVESKGGKGGGKSSGKGNSKGKGKGKGKDD